MTNSCLFHVKKCMTVLPNLFFWQLCYTRDFISLIKTMMKSNFACTQTMIVTLYFKQSIVIVIFEELMPNAY